MRIEDYSGDDASPEAAPTGSPTPSMSLAECLAGYFRERPDKWIDGRDISRVAGYGGFRSRVSDLRRLGLVIINRQSRIRVAPGRHITKSEYMLVTAAGDRP